MFTIVGGAVIINPLYAQDTQVPAGTAPATQTDAQKNNPTTLQTVTVSGVRNSLEQSMNIKRYSIGVVDAVSAEDIGKFPDTNLAESLQRITGVSIDRRDGAGSQVTVRGFGPDFNMVTVDGRHIPGADAFGAAGSIAIGNINGGTRAFNFSQLSPDGVKMLEVYKSGRANVASGGIGATIDIKTDRPFYHEGGKVIATVGAKGIYDTSQEFGSSVTPELSGLFSYANPDKTWGVGLNVSSQKRHTGAAQSTVNDWSEQPWTGTDPAFAPDINVVNAPAVGQLYGLPTDIRYSFSDMRTDRKNAHATLQFSPVDSLTMTLDYLYSRYKMDGDRGEQGMWLQRSKSFTDIEFDTDSAVATPTYIREAVGTKDFGMEQQHYAQEYKLDSIGFNAAWDVTSDFNLTFDAHDAKSQSVPNDSMTGGGATLVGLAGSNNYYSGIENCGTLPQCGGAWTQEMRFNNGLPIATRTWYPTMGDALAGTGGAVNQPFAANNIGVQPMRIEGQAQKTEIKEGSVDGTWNFENGRFQFGADFATTKLHRTQLVGTYNQLGDWSVANAGEFPDLMDHIRQADYAGMFDDFSTNGVANTAWTGKANDLAKWAASHYADADTRANTQLAADNRVDEKTRAFYAQLEMNGDLGGLTTTTRFGMRYETTDVTSSSMIAIPDAVQWLANNDFRINTSTELQPYSVKASYSNLLPNIDFNIDFTDELQGRASYSKTMARAPYGNLYAGASPGAPSGSVLLNESSRAGGSDNNPALKPLESDNLDLGLGWYFAPSSYVSVTFWEKRVDNFIGTSVTPSTLYGLTDPTSGPRAKQAQAFLESAACTAQTGSPCAVTDTTLFSTVAMLSNPETGGLAAYNGSDAQALMLENKYDVSGNADDPLYEFNVTSPVNQHKAKLHGWEFGGQYFLADTGFGILANYTKVMGDVHFDDAGDPTADQFALTGLSDTANVVLMYEKYNWSARLAWNWRGEFLTMANQGNSHNPYYVDAYRQYDLSINYDVNDHLSFQVEGINLTGEDQRWHVRSSKQMLRVFDQKPRYALGVRYKF
jgi:TonB-dependent receptor